MTVVEKPNIQAIVQALRDASQVEDAETGHKLTQLALADLSRRFGPEDAGRITLDIAHNLANNTSEAKPR